jgi:membrane-bound metal-dependent hydrolase YbcI (DUF457 family)
MYAGHFASALALKTAKPEAPTWALVAGCGLLDLVFGLLVAAGIEGVMPGWEHDHLLNIAWSHSLLTAVLLGAGFAALFFRRGWAVMLVLFAAVFSHWVLDILVHRPDMDLWPHSAIKLGFYKIFGPVSGWAETAIVVVAITIYAARARRANGYGRHWIAMCVLLAVFWAIGLAGR